MQFDFNIYSTPLLFGFLQAWIYAILFWLRAWRQERLSDGLFGCLLAALSFEIWEYMLGFGGVEVLWKQLEFFPRNFSLLLPPLAWFYLKSQFNTGFRFHWGDIKHAVPFLVYAFYHIAVFSMGPVFVEEWKEQVHYPLGIENVQAMLVFILQVVYFYRAFRLYRQYRNWSPTQFSDTEAVSFRWFRNFLAVFVASTIIGWGVSVVDIWLDLDFWHDWWDELFNACLIYYLCITGYSQTQPRRLHFAVEMVETTFSPQSPVGKTEKISDEEINHWRSKIERIMREERPYLDPELTLTELARSLQTNASVLSSAINRAFGKNFNDFVNEYRVEAVKTLLQDASMRHLSLLGIGMECGFNSKSTFNRAFRKVTGVAPSEWKVGK